jgi:hypothetical protein
MGTGSFPGVESGRGVTLTPHPLLVPRSKNRVELIRLLSLRALVACKNDETYPIYRYVCVRVCVCFAKQDLRMFKSRWFDSRTAKFGE